MKSTAEMGAFVWDRIDQIHDRPLMYGGTAEGVDLILHYYHEIIAVIHDLEDEYQEISTITHQQEGCGSANFAVHYRRDRPMLLTRRRFGMSWTDGRSSTTACLSFLNRSELNTGRRGDGVPPFPSVVLGSWSLDH